MHWACTFHVVCINSIRVGYPKQMQFSVKYGLENSYSFTIDLFINLHTVVSAVGQSTAIVTVKSHIGFSDYGITE